MLPAWQPQSIIYTIEKWPKRTDNIDRECTDPTKPAPYNWSQYNSSQDCSLIHWDSDMLSRFSTPRMFSSVGSQTTYCTWLLMGNSYTPPPCRDILCTLLYYARSLFTQLHGSLCRAGAITAFHHSERRCRKAVACDRGPQLVTLGARASYCQSCDIEGSEPERSI